MLKRSRLQRNQPRQSATIGTSVITDLPEGMRLLVQAGVEALRDPAMEQRVHEHLKGRGDSPRDVIGAALVAGRFQREAASAKGGPLARPISQTA